VTNEEIKTRELWMAAIGGLTVLLEDMKANMDSYNATIADIRAVEKQRAVMIRRVLEMFWRPARAA
jgi:hypothetical protein